MLKTQLNTDLERLGYYLTAFCLPENKDIRTRCVDAMNRTSDAIADNSEIGMRRAYRLNTALLDDCENTPIPDEVLIEIT
jgi:hypothetical protein